MDSPQCSYGFPSTILQVKEESLDTLINFEQLDLLSRPSAGL